MVGSYVDIRYEGYSCAAFYELVTFIVDNMYVSERVLINHFETHGAVHLPSKGKEYFTMYIVDVSELAHDVRARELFQQATQRTLFLLTCNGDFIIDSRVGNLQRCV